MNTEKTSLEPQSPAFLVGAVSGNFITVVALKRLIKKWSDDAKKIEPLTNKKETKHQRQVANHFLIMLSKCIEDVELELKNYR